jgi:hypothetical protein
VMSTLKNNNLKVQISCHKHNLKAILTDYIYLISYKIAKKGNPPKINLPYRKLQICNQEQDVRHIAGF